MTELEIPLNVLVEITSLLLDFFNKDHDKVVVWLTTSNLNFGGCRPFDLIYLHRGHKVLEFIKAAKEGL